MQHKSDFYRAFNSFILLTSNNVSVSTDLEQRLQSCYLSLIQSLQQYPAYFTNKSSLLLDLFNRLNTLRHNDEELDVIENPRNSGTVEQPSASDSTALVQRRYLRKGTAFFENTIQLLKDIPANDFTFYDPNLSTTTLNPDNPLQLYDDLINSTGLQNLLDKFRSMDGAENEHGLAVSYSDIDRQLSYPIGEDERINQSFDDYLRKELIKYTYQCLSVITERAGSLATNKAGTTFYVNNILSSLVSLIQSVDERIASYKAPIQPSEMDDEYMLASLEYDHFTNDLSSIKASLVDVCQHVFTLFESTVDQSSRAQLSTYLDLSTEQHTDVNEPEKSPQLIWKHTNEQFFNTFIPLIEQGALADKHDNIAHTSIYKAVASAIQVPKKTGSSYYKSSALAQTLANEYYNRVEMPSQSRK